MLEQITDTESTKLLFVHDHKFRMINNKIYSTGGITDHALSRYTSKFNQVTIIARLIKDVHVSSKYSEITNQNVKIINGLKLSSIEIESLVKDNDFVITRLPSFFGLRALNIAKKYKKPYLIEMVGCPWDALWNHSLKGKLVAPYFYFKTKKEIANSPYVIYVTNEFLQKRYPTSGKNINISNVELNHIDDTLLLNRFKKIDNITHSSKLIIGTTAAVDVRYKGQQYIIKALSKLKNDGFVNFEYQLVGGGDTTYLKAFAKKYKVIDQVKFMGNMPHQKVFEWLDTIDIYTQPSKQEGLPRALIEAMSRGLPSFGSDVGGIPELLDENYIFDQTRYNMNRIRKILLSFDGPSMKIQALINYNKSKEYEKNMLDNRRYCFFDEFKRQYRLL